MMSSLTPGSLEALAVLSGCFLLVLIFEFSNGFHDTANAVATVIYTNSLHAAVWSGLMNFLGVLLGGIAVAYALVEFIPPEVLSPPDGGTAAGMLVALFTAALVWNVGTWWFGIPNSSSHALIGALIGIAIETALTHGRGMKDGVEWHQIWSVLGSGACGRQGCAEGRLERKHTWEIRYRTRRQATGRAARRQAANIRRRNRPSQVRSNCSESSM
jgi:PiT family inorganic phosphate transporter